MLFYLFLVNLIDMTMEEALFNILGNTLESVCRFVGFIVIIGVEAIFIYDI